MNYNKALKTVFYSMVGVFILILSFFAIPFSDTLRRALFPYAGLLGLVFLILGIVLIVFTIKARVKGKLKVFLILVGSSAGMVLVSVLLHNFFYALAIVSENIVWLSWSFEFLHGMFFIIGLLVCPIVFIVGVVGSIVLFIKEK
jgi:hypothetical protein